MFGYADCQAISKPMIDNIDHSINHPIDEVIRRIFQRQLRISYINSHNYMNCTRMAIRCNLVHFDVEMWQSLPWRHNSQLISVLTVKIAIRAFIWLVAMQFLILDYCPLVWSKRVHKMFWNRLLRKPRYAQSRKSVFMKWTSSFDTFSLYCLGCILLRNSVKSRY